MNHHNELNTDLEQRITLADGRALAYVDQGDEGAPVVLFLHGSGSSRDGLDMGSRVVAAGGRLLSPARPGLGASDPLADRTLLGWAADVAELCSLLRVDRLGLVGISGGAAFGAALAHQLPNLVTGAALVSCGGPFDTPNARQGMGRANQITWLLARRLPGLLRVMLRLQAKQLERDPAALLARILRSLPEVDRAALARCSEDDRERFFIEPMAEALAQGPGPMVQDLGLLAGAWGFDPADIAVPVALWHGSADRSAPIAVAKGLGDRIPGARVNIVEGGGHLSVILDTIDDAVAFAVGSHLDPETDEDG